MTRKKSKLEILCLRIANFISKKEVRDEKKIEVRAYGIMAILSLIYNFIPLLILGLIYNNVLASIAMFLTFSALRGNSGGMHLDTPLTCFITTTTFYCVSFVLSMLTCNYSSLLVVLSLVAGFSMLDIVPKPSKHSPSQGCVRDMMFRRRYITILAIAFLINIIFESLNMVEISASISFSIIMLRILLMDKTEKTIKYIWGGTNSE